MQGTESCQLGHAVVVEGEVPRSCSDQQNAVQKRGSGKLAGLVPGSACIDLFKVLDPLDQKQRFLYKLPVASNCHTNWQQCGIPNVNTGWKGSLVCEWRDGTRTRDLLRDR